MAHSFKTNPARPAFSVFNESNNAGDYILNKKAKATFCAANSCKPSTSVNTQSNLLLLRKSNMLHFYQSGSNVDTTDLNINLITKLNLMDVNVVQPVDMSMNAVPYLYYNIDPSGELFGNTVCGINNFLNYLEYNPPYSISNVGEPNTL
jgi:hypothetical protein